LEAVVVVLLLLLLTHLLVLLSLLVLSTQYIAGSSSPITLQLNAAMFINFTLSRPSNTFNRSSFSRKFCRARVQDRLKKTEKTREKYVV
jgi:hypothetical protein